MLASFAASATPKSGQSSMGCWRAKTCASPGAVHAFNRRGKLHGTAFDCIASGVILGASMEQVDVLVKLHERIKKRKGSLE
jgi:hypothetical protein